MYTVISIIVLLVIVSFLPTLSEALEKPFCVIFFLVLIFTPELMCRVTRERLIWWLHFH